MIFSRQHQPYEVISLIFDRSCAVIVITMSSVWQNSAAVAGIGVAAVISAIYLTKRSNSPFRAAIDLNHQSIELEVSMSM